MFFESFEGGDSLVMSLILFRVFTHDYREVIRDDFPLFPWLLKLRVSCGCEAEMERVSMV